jgi:hypothetical protein
MKKADFHSRKGRRSGGGLSAQTVFFTLEGGAKYGADYDFYGPDGHGVLTAYFPPGVSTEELHLEITEDAAIEGAEQIDFSVAPGQGEGGGASTTFEIAANSPL